MATKTWQWALSGSRLAMLRMKSMHAVLSALHHVISLSGRRGQLQCGGDAANFSVHYHMLSKAFDFKAECSLSVAPLHRMRVMSGHVRAHSYSVHRS